jgi:hypothetical protein
MVWRLVILALLLGLAIYGGWRPWENPPAAPPADQRPAMSDRQEPPGSVPGSATVATPERPPRASESEAKSTREPPAAELSEPPLGQLRDAGGGVQVSTAGLRYTPGGQEGHRVQHVLRHDNDQPDRPGRHGVFDGDAETMFAVIDEAYLLTQQGGRQVRSRREGARLVHEVDLRRRIGFVGGQVGAAEGHPPATHVRLILEDDRVISAFPY